MTEPHSILYTRVGGGKSYHAKSALALNPRSAVVCGAAGEPAGDPVEADSRAIRFREGVVCGNCRSLLDTGGVQPIVTSPRPTTRRENGAERSTTMSTTTTERQKAKSRELLDVRDYKGKPDKRLREERATINNRLSGVATQLKRLGDSRTKDDVAKRRELKERQDDLLNRRDALNSELERRAPAETASNGGNPKLAAATKDASKELEKTASKTARGRRAGKKK